VVEFNPWWFSGREDLTASFFGELSASITDGIEEAAKIRELIVQLAELASHYPRWTAKVGGPAVKWFGEQKRSIRNLKADLSDKLRRNQQRIIVVIDDIDRLLPDEMLDVFRLIKAVADLPNVMYLLALDQAAVAQAITTAAKSQPGSYDDSYLEQIVQLSIQLPIPDKMALRVMFADRLQPILTEKSATMFDKEYYRDVYMEGIDRFPVTPRDVVGLTNALKLTFPIVEGERSPVADAPGNRNGDHGAYDTNPKHSQAIWTDLRSRTRRCH
jgi:predicted KAP-like P-loop ATPase